MNNLHGRTAIVTGGAQGLGLAIAEAFAREGANLAICGRNPTALEEAARHLTALAPPGFRLETVHADIAKPAEVERLMETTLRTFGRLHVLVNNAGIYGPMGPAERVDWIEWMATLEINLLGSVLMCRAVLPHFKAHRYGKIIQLSGGGATAPMPGISAYAASKAAVVRFAETLAMEVKDDGIDVNAVAPGALNTRMLDEVLKAGPEKVGSAYYQKALHQKTTGGASLAQAASLAVYLASAASDGLTGKLISAVWDPWRQFADHSQELRETDVYTLRRIVPADRHMNWGEPA